MIVVVVVVVIVWRLMMRRSDADVCRLCRAVISSEHCANTNRLLVCFVMLIELNSADCCYYYYCDSGGSG
jgi:hypothetical protein